jgi:hypothetical protein
LELSPDVSQIARLNQLRIVELEPLVRMKLTAFRDKDRVHLRDLLEVGLVDVHWLERLPAQLADRLKILLDSPEG